MKSKLTYASCLFAMLAFVVSPLASAQTQQRPEARQLAQQNVNDIKQRVQERKDRLKTRLDNKQFTRITDKCTGVQGKLNSLTVKFENSDKPQRAKYDNYLQRLEKLQARLKEKGVDTAKLDQNIEVLKQKITALKTSIEQYKTAVNDAKAVDCKNDPAGFKAALDDARTQAKAVQTARADLKVYAKDTIKPTLEELRAAAKASKQGQ